MIRCRDVVFVVACLGLHTCFVAPLYCIVLFSSIYIVSLNSCKLTEALLAITLSVYIHALLNFVFLSNLYSLLLRTTYAMVQILLKQSPY